MKKSIILGILIFSFFLTARLAFAALEITEIMYAPDTADAEHEWVEIYNNGNSNEDISSWAVTDYDTKWHYHSIVPDSSATLSAGSYAIIGQTSLTKFNEFTSNFKSKWPNTNTLFFRASFDLGNDSGRIGLSSDGLAVVSDISYTSALGAKDDGNSLQKINNAWVPALPTPGLTNQANNSSTNDTTTTTTTTNNNFTVSSGAGVSSTTVKLKEPEIPKITTNIITKKIVFAGLPFIIDSKTIGLRKEILTTGKYFWNFGDGMSKEKEHNQFSYTYEYPGEYVLTLDYWQYYNYYGSPDPDAGDRIIIKVVPSEVSISSVGIEQDPYIELENKSSYEIDLSNWILKGSASLFTLPKGMILLQGKTIKFSPKITGFNFADLSSVSLMRPTGEEVTVYPIQKTTNIVKNVSNYNNNYFSKMPVVSPVNTSNIKENNEVINLDNLGASAEGARASIPSYFAYIGLALIIILGGIAVYLSRCKFFSARKFLAEDEVEGKIRPEDINIME